MRALQRICVVCGLAALIAGLAGCGSTDEQRASSVEKLPSATAQKEQIQRLVVTQLNELQAQVAEQNKKLTDMQVLHDRQVSEVVTANQALADRINQMKLAIQTGETPAGETATPKVAAPAKATGPEVPAESKEEPYKVGQFLFRIILVLVVLGVISFFIIKFMGRWDEGEEIEAGDEEEEEASGEDETEEAGPKPPQDSI